MKIKFNTKDLKNAVNTVSKAIHGKSINFSGIFINVANGKVTITASNNEFTIIKKVDAIIFEEGLVIVNGKTFAEFIRIVTSEEIILEENASTVDEYEGKRLKITYDFFNVLYLECLPDKYSTIIDNIEDFDFIMSEDLFKEVAESAMYCVSKEDSRAYLKGCFFEIIENKLVAVSLDGYRMAIVKNEIIEKLNDFKALILGKTLDDVVNVLEKSDKLLKIKNVNNKLYLKNSDTTIILRLMELDFYDYQSIIPKETTIEILISKEDFENCIDRVDLMCIKGYEAINIFIKDNEICVKSKNEIAEIKETVKCEKTGEDIEISFNCKYIKEALEKCKEKEIKISIISNIKPVTITPVVGDKFKHIILPVRLK
ncbi:MAG: DNA polymerase III subunit beta [Christensenellaceae bacterium]|jgi:DNA polymerase-3 subunit beta|nr:DNA polymerase III subunit beta [Christensenellaceae bacterium]